MENIVVFGIGGIGGYLGSRLSELKEIPKYRGLEVTFVARGEHLEVIRKNGLAFLDPRGEETLHKPTRAVDNLDSLPKVDLCFICVKGYDLEGAVRALEPKISPQTVIIPLLNGADIYERIRRITDKGILLPGCIYIGANIVKPGKVQQTGGKGLVILGRDPGKRDFNKEPLLALLEDARVPYRWEEDPRPAIWEKYLFIASFALITGLSGKSIGGVMENMELRAKTRLIMEEISALAATKGVVLPENALDKVFTTALSFPFETKTSYQRDLEQRKEKTEGELFGGTILRLGEEMKIPTPVTREVWTTLSAFNLGRRN